MNFLDFNFTSFMTIGIELELLILDHDTLLPKNDTKNFFNSISNNQFLQKEYYSQMLEVISPVLNNVDEIGFFLNDIFLFLKKITATHNLNLYSCGTHPLMFINNVSVSENIRYFSLKKELQDILKRFLIMGLHIHIGMKSETHLINSFNTVNYLLPLFLSLSVSSPFFEGRNTGILSYRNMILDSLPRSGNPEYFEHYENFINLFDNLYKNKIIESFNDIWWDVRPRPDLGTLELRICDSIPDIQRIQSIAALFQAICLNSLEKKQKYFYHQIAKQNKWNCVRHSSKGKFIDYDNICTIKEKILNIVDSLNSKGIFKELKTEKYVELIKKFLNEKSISENMIESYEKENDFQKAIKQGVLF